MAIAGHRRRHHLAVSQMKSFNICCQHMTLCATCRRLAKHAHSFADAEAEPLPCAFCPAACANTAVVVQNSFFRDNFGRRTYEGRANALGDDVPTDWAIVSRSARWDYGFENLTVDSGSDPFSFIKGFNFGAFVVDGGNSVPAGSPANSFAANDVIEQSVPVVAACRYQVYHPLCMLR